MEKAMRYSALTQRIAGEGSAAWDIHYRALALREQGRDVLLLTIGDPDFDTPGRWSRRPSTACWPVTPTIRMCAATWRCAVASPVATTSAPGRSSMPSTWWCCRGRSVRCSPWPSACWALGTRCWWPSPCTSPTKGCSVPVAPPWCRYQYGPNRAFAWTRRKWRRASARGPGPCSSTAPTTPPGQPVPG
ncbi:hypothetical protein PBOI14_43170 [Pseudomonas sp. Boi14]|nr:hypothetical protein PBOI14_43170 [Pseudomonas sp. Boi14]